MELGSPASRDGAAHSGSCVSIKSHTIVGRGWRGLGEHGLPFPGIKLAWGLPQLLTGLEPSRSQSLTLPKHKCHRHKSLRTDFVECFKRRLSSARFGHNFIPFKRDQHRVSRHTVVSLCAAHSRFPHMMSSHFFFKITDHFVVFTFLISCSRSDIRVRLTNKIMKSSKLILFSDSSSKEEMISWYFGLFSWPYGRF